MARQSGVSTQTIKGSATAQGIGTVKAVTGEVTAVDSAGVVRQLKAGDTVFQNETIQTQDGSVSIAFQNGQHLDLGRNSSMLLDFDVFKPADELAAAPADRAAEVSDAEKIQQLIAQGVDPTQITEATAAGPTGAGGGGDDGGGSIVVVAFNDTQRTLSSGFDTGGINVNLLDPIANSDPGTPPAVNQPPDAVDDGTIPDAINDALITRENTPLTIDPAVLLANDTDPEGDPLTIISVQGAVNGTVALIDGKVVFTPDEGFNGSGSFTYTITDGKGGVDTATVKIGVTPVDPPVVDFLDSNGEAAGNNTIVENAQAGVTGNILLQADGGIASVTLTGSEGSITLTLAQLLNLGGSPAEFVTEHGTLILTGFDSQTGTLSYEFVVNPGGQDHSNGALSDSISISLTDQLGQTGTDTGSINILDTVPQAIDDAVKLSEDGYGEESESIGASGNVLDNDLNGADDPKSFISWNGSGTVVAPAGLSTVLADYGTLQLNANGSYSFVLANDSAAVQRLTTGDTVTLTVGYTMQDADGDPSSAQLVISIQGANDGVSITGLSGEGAEETVYEANLADGRSPDAGALTQTGSFSVSTPDGFAGLWIGSKQVVNADGTLATDHSVSSALGTLTVTGYSNGTVSYSYTLVNDANHPTGDGSNSMLDSFAVKVMDRDGDSQTASLDVKVVDDLPQAVNDTPSVREDGATQSLSASVLSNDLNGADDPKSFVSWDGSGTVVAPAGLSTVLTDYGTLQLNANGSYSFVLANDSAAVQRLTTGDTVTL
ncbi:retention module-containing protein, partial [Chitinilyticum piscinae]